MDKCELQKPTKIYSSNQSIIDTTITTVNKIRRKFKCLN
jgi:hypothetical protein